MADLNPRLVFAAGGVVWRPAGGTPDPARADREPAGREIVLVHRPRYDDWTLPKGKLEHGEHPLAAAVREVYEETGVRGLPQLRLPRVRYLTGDPGVEKVVDFWAMRARSWVDRAPDREVDDVRWVPVEQAPDLLTYVHDRGVLKAFVEHPPVTGLVALVRHASAGERREWTGPDAERPLNDQGRAEAAALTDVLERLEPGRVISATPLRCVQTMRPLADRTDREVERDQRFDESADALVAAAALRGLAATGDPIVVCSQGELIPRLLVALTGRAPQLYKTAKGTGWVLAFARHDVAAVDYFDPAS